MKVVMLGWELPPNITGGLGMACQGLIKGMKEVADISLTFVMPRLYGDEVADNARLIAANAFPACRLSEQPISQRPCRDSSESSGGAYQHKSVHEAWEFALRMDALSSNIGDARIIHAHDWLTLPAALQLRRRLGCPFIAHVHSTEFERAGQQQHPGIVAIERQGLSAADRVIAVSRCTRRILIEEYGIPPGKIHVVHNAADHQPLISPGRPKAERVVSFIGRMSWQKGPSLFIQAANHVARHLPDVRFVMAGEGDRLAMMKTLAAALGLATRLDFPGFLDTEGVSGLLMRSSVYVMPSMAEPFGIGALEAIRSGVPVVLSRTCGVTEAIRHVTTVDTGNSTALADAIVYLLTHPEAAMQQAVSAQHEAAAWSWSDAAQAVQAVYRTLTRHGDMNNGACMGCYGRSLETEALSCQD